MGLDEVEFLLRQLGDLIGDRDAVILVGDFQQLHGHEAVGEVEFRGLLHLIWPARRVLLSRAFQQALGERLRPLVQRRDLHHPQAVVEEDVERVQHRVRGDEAGEMLAGVVVQFVEELHLLVVRGHDDEALRREALLVIVAQHVLEHAEVGDIAQVLADPVRLDYWGELGPVTQVRAEARLLGEVVLLAPAGRRSGLSGSVCRGRFNLRQRGRRVRLPPAAQHERQCNECNTERRCLLSFHLGHSPHMLSLELDASGLGRPRPHTTQPRAAPPSRRRRTQR